MEAYITKIGDILLSEYGLAGIVIVVLICFIVMMWRFLKELITKHFDRYEEGRKETVVVLNRLTDVIHEANNRHRNYSRD